jgi:hypothetical protein
MFALSAQQSLLHASANNGVEPKVKLCKQHLRTLPVTISITNFPFAQGERHEIEITTDRQSRGQASDLQH